MRVAVCRYKVPTLVVGGGGYTLRNVARCWCYETGRLMGHDLPDKLPDSVLNSFNYYMDNEKLRIEVRTGCGSGLLGQWVTEVGRGRRRMVTLNIVGAEGQIDTCMNPLHWVP